VIIIDILKKPRNYANKQSIARRPATHAISSRPGLRGWLSLLSDLFQYFFSLVQVAEIKLKQNSLVDGWPKNLKLYFSSTSVSCQFHFT